VNGSFETVAFSINHYPDNRVLTISKYSSMFTSHSQILENNKIRASPRRKPRMTLQSYYAFIANRPLNIVNNGEKSNRKKTISNLSLKQLVERNKELRLGHISTHHNPNRLGLSTKNQQSLMGPSYNAPMASPKMKKLSIGNMPDIHQHSSRTQTTTCQSLTEQQKILMPIDSRHQSLPKIQSSMPTTDQPTISKPLISTNTQPIPISYNDYFKQWNNTVIHLHQGEEDEDNLAMDMDEEFREYFQKAIIKCADWLIKSVFDKKYHSGNQEF
jgi:hypothetical protein